jgi:predicted Zn-dependent protease
VLIQHDIDRYQLYQAVDGLTEFLRHRPDDLQALLARGYVWERLLYFSDALEDYRKAVAAHPDHAPARLKLADVLLLAGTPTDALEQFSWLAERHPERLEVRLGLARCRQKLGQRDEAQRLLDGLSADFPDNGEVLWERGQLELDQDRPAEAQTWLRRAARLLPQDRRVAYSLYRCLLSLDRCEEAEAVNARVAQLDADLRRLSRLRQEVMKRPDDADLRCEVGLIFLRNGERQEGIRWLQMALRLDPTCEAARTALAKPEDPAR